MGACTCARSLTRVRWIRPPCRSDRPKTWPVWRESAAPNCGPKPPSDRGRDHRTIIKPKPPVIRGVRLQLWMGQGPCNWCPCFLSLLEMPKASNTSKIDMHLFSSARSMYYNIIIYFQKAKQLIVYIIYLWAPRKILSGRERANQIQGSSCNLTSGVGYGANGVLRSEPAA